MTSGDADLARTQDDRDIGHDELLRFVERFALLLTSSGLPRMPARVFAYVIADDAERYTARELAEGLRVSPAAISGALKVLVGSGILARDRTPGERSDHYRVFDEDVWMAIGSQRLELLSFWEDGLDEGIRLLGPNRPGGRRLMETKAYFEFMSEELPKLYKRWHQRRKALFPDDP
jgi:DNA-binding transcriptional ArsR family regulator